MKAKRERSEAIRSIAEQDALIVQFQYLPAHVAARMRHKPLVSAMELDDAISAGRLGLVRAAERWLREHPKHATFKTFAYRVIYHAIQDEADATRRRSVPFTDVGKGFGDDLCAPQADADFLERAKLHRMLTLLPERTRNVLRLHYWEDWHFKAIGEQMGGLTRERARQLVNEGLDSLARLMGVAPKNQKRHHRKAACR